ncbi:MAG: tetratricopeptide repeat protein [Nitrospirae bacterium]|nr:tetratricopeptide repeat protein [Nitrospirota bacterium]
MSGRAAGVVPAHRGVGLLPLLLIVLTLVAYWPVREQGFVRWDEQLYVTENPFLVEPDGLWKAWTTTRETERQYAPLVLTTFWIQHRLWGYQPAGYHAVNLWFHLSNGVLVLFLLAALGAGRWVAGAGALLFALHPIQVESVAWVAELKNLQMGFFYLAAFLLYLVHRSAVVPAAGQGPFVMRWAGWGWAAYGGVLLLYACALLSKVAAVTLPLSLFLADWLLVAPRDRRWWRGSLARIAPMLVMGIAPSAIAIGLEQGPDPASIPVMALRPFIASAAIWFYLGKLMAPFSLIPIYPRWDLSVMRFWLLLAFVGLGGVFIVLWRWRRRMPPLALWGMGHFAVTLLPVLGLVPFGYLDHSFVANHFVYLACIGMFVAIAVTVERFVKGDPMRRWMAIGVLCIVLAGFVVLIRAQLPVWRDPLSFWGYLAMHNPRSETVHNNLGNAYFRGNRLEEAADHYRMALRINPDSGLAHMNLGLVFQQQGRVAAAIDEYLQSIRSQPSDWLSHYNLAQAYVDAGRQTDAIREADEAIALARRVGRNPEADTIGAWSSRYRSSHPSAR